MNNHRIEIILQTMYFRCIKQEIVAKFACRLSSCIKYQYQNLQFLKNPVETLLKAQQERGNQITTLQTMDKFVSKIEEGLIDQLFIIKQNIKQMKIQMESMNREIEINLRLGDVVQQFHYISELDSCQESKELTSLEENLNSICKNLKKTINDAKYSNTLNQQLIIDNLNNKYKNVFIQSFKMIQNDISQLNKYVVQQLMKMIPNSIPSNIFDELYEFPDIHYLISGGQKIQYKLIYQGSRDGLNPPSYWSKCDTYSHLLTIMTSRNVNIFGGYSPIQLNKQLHGQYREDSTMKSFLSQYNKKEIYKLKVKEKSFLFDNYCGPIFGEGWDLLIDSNFNAKSKLGHSYDISNYNIKDADAHLLGAQTQQIVECKVYKVICE